MTTELWYLFLTSVLLTVLWIPYIIGSVQTAGPLTPEEYRVGRHVEFPHWVRRADRAHVNLVEQFGAFAGLVVVAHLTGVHNALAVWCVIVFFWARILHADRLYRRRHPVQRAHGDLHDRLPCADRLRRGHLHVRHAGRHVRQRDPAA